MGLAAAAAPATKRVRARRRWLPIWAGVAFWALYSLLYASQYYIGFETGAKGPSWWRLAGWQLSVNFIWAVATPAIIEWCRRYPFEKAIWARRVAAILGGASVISLMQIAAYTLLTRAFAIFPNWRIEGRFEQFIHFISMYFHLNLLICLSICGIGYAVAYYEKYRERELQTVQLRAQLAQAQLQALRMQLQPHFLFNTLNSVVGLIRTQESDAAIRMVTGLSDLLRHVLDGAARPETALAEELEFLERYLAIQQMRFGDRLRVELDIHPDVARAALPSLILQPLVENAIRHGIAAREEGGRVRVKAWRRGGDVEIEVYNDGPPLPAGWRGGIGLSNTRARLEQIYGTRQSLELANSGEGVVARLRLPYRPYGEHVEGDAEEDSHADR